MTQDSRAQKKHRLFLLDILRIICAFLIYARHSVTMYGCTYGSGLDEWFIMMTSPVMTCFFILSGFSIHYQHGKEELSAGWTRRFLARRLIAIMPSYLLVVFLWPLAYPEQLKDWLILLPADLVGVQTAYHSLFGILHNGGTWFVSCLLFAYLSYPVLKAVLGSVKRWAPAALLIAAHFLLIYSNFVIPRFSLDRLYSNPIARTAEFWLGAAFSELLFRDGEKPDAAETVGTDVRSGVFTILLLTVVSLILALVSHENIQATVYGYLVIPAVFLILLISSLVRSRLLENSRVLSVLSGISYQFFLAQLFLWKLTSWVLGMLGLGGNRAKLGVSLVLCTLLSYTVWRFYDKPVRKFLSRKLLR